MIVAWHSIFSMYGFWLPNDPRGSGSDFVAAWELFRYGHATKTNSEVSRASMPHDHAQRLAAKTALRYPPVEISGRQALAIAGGFRRACDESGYTIYACAILPDHVHLVVAHHRRRIRRLIGHLKSRATLQLREQGLWPDPNRPVWGENGWNIMLEDEEDIYRSIAYVEQNPMKEGKKPQQWSFVTPFYFCGDFGVESGSTTMDRDARLVPRHSIQSGNSFLQPDLGESEPPPRIGGAALRSHLAKKSRAARDR